MTRDVPTAETLQPERLTGSRAADLEDDDGPADGGDHVAALIGRDQHVVALQEVQDRDDRRQRAVAEPQASHALAGQQAPAVGVVQDQQAAVLVERGHTNSP